MHTLGLDQQGWANKGTRNIFTRPGGDDNAFGMEMGRTSRYLRLLK